MPVELYFVKGFVALRRQIDELASCGRSEPGGPARRYFVAVDQELTSPARAGCC
jgi:hypothetical protein